MDYNFDFQVELLRFLLHGNKLGYYINKIDSDLFSGDCLKHISNGICNFFNTYNCVPSKGVLKQYLKDSNVNSSDCFDVVDGLYTPFNFNNSEYLEQKIKDFISYKTYQKAAIQIATKVAKKEFDGLDKIFEDTAASLNFEKDLGQFLFRDIDLRNFDRSIELEEPISLLMPTIDQHLSGGAYKKTLNIIMAGTNVGKSIMLINIGVAASLLGKTVFHITLEMSQEQTLDRYDSRMSLNKMSELYNCDKVKNDLLLNRKRFGCGEILVKEYPTGCATVNDIRAYIKEVELQYGITPDMLIVDYGDLLKKTYYKDGIRHAISENFTKLRGIGVELDIPVWSATQTNRQGMREDNPNITHASEDMGKIRVADTILILAQTEEEADRKEMRIIGGKVRNAAKNWVVKLQTKLDYMWIGEYRDLI